jgi:phosphocarrier protein HPr
MIRQTIEVKNVLGLHARAAAKLVRLASRFASDVYLSREGARQQVDSKSILGVLMLAASAGTRLELSASGQDEKEASEAIVQLFEDRFGEQGIVSE